MRTTIDLPAELMRRAKMAALERGATLKELFTRALQRELESPSPVTSPRRTRFPIFRSQAPGALKLDASAIARLEDEEEARRHGLTD